MFRSLYDLAFQISPVIFSGGIASGIRGGMLPVVATLSSLIDITLSQDIPWRFVVKPGGTVINQAIGLYPFANQRVAANAVVEEPLYIGLQLISPVNQTAGYTTKLAVFTSLRDTFQNHIDMGGTFIIATPSYIYEDCLLLSITDATSGTRQQQILWNLEFQKPLVSTSGAKQAYSQLLDKIEKNLKVGPNPEWHGFESAVTAGLPTGTFDRINRILGAVQ